MDCLLAGVAPRRVFLATKDRVEDGRDHLLEEVNRYKMKNEQIKKLISEEGDEMKAISTCLVNLE